MADLRRVFDAVIWNIRHKTDEEIIKDATEEGGIYLGKCFSYVAPTKEELRAMDLSELKSHKAKALKRRRELEIELNGLYLEIERIKHGLEIGMVANARGVVYKLSSFDGCFWRGYKQMQGGGFEPYDSFVFGRPVPINTND